MWFDFVLNISKNYKDIQINFKIKYLYKKQQQLVQFLKCKHERIVILTKIYSEKNNFRTSLIKYTVRLKKIKYKDKLKILSAYRILVLAPYYNWAYSFLFDNDDNL